MQAHSSDINPVDRDKRIRSALDHAEEDLDQGGLPSASTPDAADSFSSIDLEGDALENKVLAELVIAHLYILKFDAPGTGPSISNLRITRK